MICVEFGRCVPEESYYGPPGLRAGILFVDRFAVARERGHLLASDFAAAFAQPLDLAEVQQLQSTLPSPSLQRFQSMDPGSYF